MEAVGVLNGIDRYALAVWCGVGTILILNQLRGSRVFSCGKNPCRRFSRANRRGEGSSLSMASSRLKPVWEIQRHMGH